MNPYISSAWGWVLGAKVWLIVLVVATAAAYGAGWYGGSTHEARIMAEAATHAAQAAQQAQAKKSADDYAAGAADYAKRHPAQVKVEKQYEIIYRDRRVLVPNPTHCAVPAPAMKSLSDLIPQEIAQ